MKMSDGRQGTDFKSGFYDQKREERKKKVFFSPMFLPQLGSSASGPALVKVFGHSAAEPLFHCSHSIPLISQVFAISALVGFLKVQPL